MEELTMIQQPVVIFPDCNRVAQENPMPRRKKMARIDLRVDQETLDALDKLRKIFGPDVSGSEIIREAILEKAEREAKRLQDEKLSA